MTPPNKFVAIYTSFIILVDSLHKLSSSTSFHAHPYASPSIGAAATYPAVSNCSCTCPAPSDSAFSRVYDCVLSGLITFAVQLVWREGLRIFRKEAPLPDEEVGQDEDGDEGLGDGLRGLTERVLVRVPAGAAVEDVVIPVSTTRGGEQELDLGPASLASGASGSEDSWRRRAQSQAAEVRARRQGRRAP